MAACLQDHHRATIIGERTWGKGSVQSVIELEDGKSALKLTTAAYRRPNGKNIHRFPDAKETDEWGVMPDAGFDIRLDDDEMVALVQDRRARDVLKRPHATAAAKQPAEARQARRGRSPTPGSRQALDRRVGEGKVACVSERKAGSRSFSSAAKNLGRMPMFTRFFAAASE